MLTGHADEKAIKRTQEEANLFACIQKPWSESTLIHTIESGLEEYDG